MKEIHKLCPTCLGSGHVPSGRQVKALLEAYQIKHHIAARALNISRSHLCGILNGHREFTPELSGRLAAFLGGVDSQNHP